MRVKRRSNAGVVKAGLLKMASNRLRAAAQHFNAKVKVKLSVAAPKRRVRGRSGAFYYVATTKATPGAPPRLITGHLRRSTETEMVNSLVYRVHNYAIYGRKHEVENHKYLTPTLREELPTLRRIVGGPFSVTLHTGF